MLLEGVVAVQPPQDPPAGGPPGARARRDDEPSFPAVLAAADQDDDGGGTARAPNRPPQRAGPSRPCTDEMPLDHVVGAVSGVELRRTAPVAVFAALAGAIAPVALDVSGGGAAADASLPDAIAAIGGAAGGTPSARATAARAGDGTPASAPAWVDPATPASAPAWVDHGTPRVLGFAPEPPASESTEQARAIVQALWSITGRAPSIAGTMSLSTGTGVTGQPTTGVPGITSQAAAPVAPGVGPVPTIDAAALASPVEISGTMTALAEALGGAAGTVGPAPVSARARPTPPTIAPAMQGAVPPGGRASPDGHAVTAAASTEAVSTLPPPGDQYTPVAAPTGSTPTVTETIDGARRLTRSNEAVALGPPPDGAALAAEAGSEEVAGPRRSAPAPETQIVSAVRLMRMARRDEVRLRLDPPDLGVVRVRLVEADGRVSVHLRAEEAGTAHALQQAMPALRQALEHVQVHLADLDAALGNGFAFNTSHSGRGQTDGDAPGTGAQRLVLEEEPAVAVAPRRTDSDRLIDYRA